MLFCNNSNVKALYQSAISNLRLGTTTGLEQAKRHLVKAFKLESDNTHVQKLLKYVKREIKQQRTKDKAHYGGLFTRGGIYEEKSELGLQEGPFTFEDLLNLPPPPKASWVSYLPSFVKDIIRNSYSRFVLVMFLSLIFSRVCVLFFKLVSSSEEP